MNNATVILDGVRKSYGGRQVVHDLSYHLSPGEVVALVGHNGAGKTTQIKMMLGLVRRDAGLLQVLGADPAQGRHARQALGYLPESVQFHPSFTARETLTFYARLKGLPAQGHEALFDRVGLADAADRPVRGYSKGMRQRLGLAQAILGQPRLLLLDEPTSGRLIADGTMEELRRLAGLPSVLRFRADGTPQGAARIGDHWQVKLSEAEKPAALRAALEAGARDITLEDPSLDDIYAHFLRREAA